MIEKFLVNIGEHILTQIFKAIFLEWKVFKKKSEIKKSTKEIEDAETKAERIRAIADLSNTHHDGGFM